MLFNRQNIERQLMLLWSKMSMQRKKIEDDDYADMIPMIGTHDQYPDSDIKSEDKDKEDSINCHSS